MHQGATRRRSSSSPSQLVVGGLALVAPQLVTCHRRAAEARAAVGVYEAPARGRTPAMSGHIIGRPDDDQLDILLGPGAEPEQAFIGGRAQGPEEGDGFEDRLLGEAPTVPEQ